MAIGFKVSKEEFERAADNAEVLNMVAEYVRKTQEEINRYARKFMTKPVRCNPEEVEKAYLKDYLDAESEVKKSMSLDASSVKFVNANKKLKALYVQILCRGCMIGIMLNKDNTVKKYFMRPLTAKEFEMVNLEYERVMKERENGKV